MIISPPYSLFDLSQLLALAEQSYNITSERHPEEVLFTNVLETLSTALEDSRLAIGSSQKEALTQELIYQDSLRDDSYLALARYIEAGLKRHSRPEHQEASERLADILTTNGRDLYTYSYDRQTAAMESLFKDFDGKESRADIATINATEWLEEARVDHEAFKQIKTQRDEAKANRNIPTNVTAQKELKTALDNLYTVLNAFSLSTQIEGLDQTIEIHNQSISRVLSAVRQSTPLVRNNTSDEEPEEGEGTEETPE